MKPFPLLVLLSPVLLLAAPAFADETDGGVRRKGFGIIFLHIIPALLALRKIWSKNFEGLAWRIAWSLLATCVPFIGPLLFFGLGQVPLQKARSPGGRSGSSVGFEESTSMGFGGAGAAGIPGLMPEEDPDATTTMQLAAECRLQAEKGDAKAQTRLGTLYEYGDNVKQDYAEAMVWYRKAANQGFAPAQNLLGEMYAKGAGVAKSNDEACFWFTIAAMSDAKFIERRDESAATLAPERIDAVRKRVRTWSPVDPAMEGKGLSVS
jgi:hypothetical protein